MSTSKINKLLSHVGKPVWNVAGSIFVAIGLIGIFLPLLPTTPFLLLAAYCFNRGSDKMRNWFENNKTIRAYIVNYREKKGMTLRAKMNSIFVLWFTIGVSAYLIENVYVRIILAIVVVSVTIHLLRIQSINNKSKT